MYAPQDRNVAFEYLQGALARPARLHRWEILMGKKTIAEFVENREVLALLGSIGVDYAQGHGIGRPVPLDVYTGRRVS